MERNSLLVAGWKLRVEVRLVSNKWPGAAVRAGVSAPAPGSQRGAEHYFVRRVDTLLEGYLISDGDQVNQNLTIFCK